jgi:hypothetical protein
MVIISNKKKYLGAHTKIIKKLKEKYFINIS